MIKHVALGTLAALALTVGAATSPASAETRDVVDTAVQAGSFKTLAKALEAAGLIATLKGPGPFTVFAPTDEAFAKLPAGTLEMLLEPANRAKLQRILTYHVVPGRVMAADVATLRSATAVSGDAIAVTARHGAVTVANARVVTADIAASNGVIHVIDAVMLPSED